MSTRRFSIFSKLQICLPRHRRRTWMAGSLSTASRCNANTPRLTSCRKTHVGAVPSEVRCEARDLAVCVEVVWRDLQGDSVLGVALQLVGDETRFLHQEVCSHYLLPQPPETSHQNHLPGRGREKAVKSKKQSGGRRDEDCYWLMISINI